MKFAVDSVCNHALAKHPKLVFWFCLEWLVLLITSVLSYLFLGSVVQSMINQQLAVGPDSDLFPLWKDPPVNPVMSIYLFNYTNVESWLNGSEIKLNVNQLGPYIYKEKWIKTNITFNDGTDSTVSYELVKQYNFVPDKSVNLPENDLITMPNIPLFAAGSSMKDANYFTLAGFKAAINMLGEDKAQPIFVRKTVQEVLWGYDDKLTEMGRKFMPSADLKTDQFGLLAGKNMSSDGVYVVYTGSDDLTRLGQIKSFKGQEYYNVWPSPECDKIIGGEGSFNPPMLDMKSKVDIMVGDLCRSIKLIPTKIVQVGQIEALRFVPDPDLFNYEAEQNRCYCPGDQGRQASEDDSDFIEWFGEDFGTQPETIGSKCSGSGLFDVGPCKYGSPLVTSWPHFLDVQPKDDFRLQFVQGLNPDPEKHNFYMDIQPIMGMGLSAHVRLQLNLRMEKSPALPELMNLPIHDDAKSGILVPIMWFDDSIEEPPEDLMVLLKDALATGPSLSQASLVMSLISLIGQQVIFCTFILWSYHRHSPTFPDVD